MKRLDIVKQHPSLIKKLISELTVDDFLLLEEELRNKEPETSNAKHVIVTTFEKIFQHSCSDMRPAVTCSHRRYENGKTDAAYQGFKLAIVETRKALAAYMAKKTVRDRYIIGRETHSNYYIFNSRPQIHSNLGRAVEEAVRLGDQYDGKFSVFAKLHETRHQRFTDNKRVRIAPSPSAPSGAVAQWQEFIRNATEDTPTYPVGFTMTPEGQLSLQWSDPLTPSNIFNDFSNMMRFVKRHISPSGPEEQESVSQEQETPESY